MPHQTTIGWRDPRQMLTAVFRLCGHPAAGPKGVLDQSNARVRSPISPPPARNDRSAASCMALLPNPARTPEVKVWFLQRQANGGFWRRYSPRRRRSGLQSQLETQLRSCHRQHPSRLSALRKCRLPATIEGGRRPPFGAIGSPTFSDRDIDDPSPAKIGCSVGVGPRPAQHHIAVRSDQIEARPFYSVLLNERRCVRVCDVPDIEELRQRL